MCTQTCLHAPAGSRRACFHFSDTAVNALGLGVKNKTLLYLQPVTHLTGRKWPARVCSLPHRLVVLIER